MSSTYLRDAILNELSLRDKECLLADPVFSAMIDDLTDFVTAAMDKFIAGQREHGGSLIDRDLLSELQKEHMDSFWYISFLKRKLEHEKNKT